MEAELKRKETKSLTTLVRQSPRKKEKMKYAPSLLGVKQEVEESLRVYMERFNKACLEIINLPMEAVVMRLVNGL
ncbi:hypothetical protein PIB30_055045 [Stylosanthes scabra]|uniref:Uncharacterized protein n=1 Tax=Stylosanthes scabra TaxID=79078 RepID=A0ABU6VKY1_9FABA|nr:hypothetical protein [Stylosanthes scabra]